MTLKILTFTTLYPSCVRPNHGVFVENRLRHLLASGEVDARVVAPVPWFPFRSARFGGYAQFAQTPHHENRSGVDIIHPRYPLIPKLGMVGAPWMLYRAVRPTVRRLIDAGFDFDVIDAHYFYPDGVAAVMLARHFGKPVVVTGRGTDLNLIPQYRIPRHMISRAAARASGLITVCQALKDELIKLGTPAERVRVLRNGVDLNLFRPWDREESKEL